MANALYGKYKEGLYTNSAPAVDWDNHDIKICLVSSSYTVNLATHQYKSDLSGIVATSGNLSGKSHTLGVIKASNPTIAAVTGSQVVAIVVWRDTGVAGTSPLIAYIDTMTGLPFTPSGADETISFDATNGIWS
jgi:hypothetical protein